MGMGYLKWAHLSSTRSPAPDQESPDQSPCPLRVKGGTPRLAIVGFSHKLTSQVFHSRFAASYPLTIPAS
jgi:hypothetical protein